MHFHDILALFPLDQRHLYFLFRFSFLGERMSMPNGRGRGMAVVVIQGLVISPCLKSICSMQG